MAEEHPQNTVETVEDVQEVEEQPVKKSGRGVMTEAKLANLAKAREARKKNLEAKKTKYPKNKRASLEQKIQEEEENTKRMEEEIERKARELLERQKQEQELAEYRQWKKEQEKLAKESAKEESKKPSKVKSATKKTAPAKTATKKTAPKKRKAPVEDYGDSSEEEKPVRSTGRATRAKKAVPSLSYSTDTGYDWLDDVLASNTNMLRAYQCYMKFTVTPRDATGAVITDAATLAAIRTSKQGCSRIFSRITLRSGSQILESFEYDDQLALYLSTISDTKRKFLRITEGFERDTLYTNGPREFAMQIWSSLFSNDVAIPLFAFQGGLQLEFQVAGAENYFLTNNVPRFTVDNPTLRFCAITPDPSFVLGLTSAIQSGRSMWLPMTELRTFRMYGNGGADAIYNIAVGNITSIDSVSFTHWDSATYNNRASDRYTRFYDAGLKSWSIEANQILNPGGNKQFLHGTRTLDTFRVTFLSEAGSIHNLDQVANIRSLDPNVLDFDAYRLQNFKAGINYVSDLEQHASGLSMVGSANPNVVINASYTGNVGSGTITYITVSISTVLEVTGTMINVVDNQLSVKPIIRHNNDYDLKYSDPIKIKWDDVDDANDILGGTLLLDYNEKDFTLDDNGQLQSVDLNLVAQGAMSVRKSDFSLGEIDEKLRVFKIDTSDQFQQTGGVLDIRSQGAGKIPFYQIASGFATTGLFTFDGNILKVPFVRSTISYELPDDYLGTIANILFAYQSEVGSGIDVLPPTANRRLIKIRTDTTTGSTYVNGANQLAVSTNTEGAITSIPGVGLDVKLDPSGVLKLDPGLGLDVRIDGITLKNAGSVLMGNYAGMAPVRILENEVSLGFDEESLTILPGGLLGAHLGIGLLRTPTGITLDLDGGQGVLIATNEISALTDMVTITFNPEGALMGNYKGDPDGDIQVVGNVISCLIQAGSGLIKEGSIISVSPDLEDKVDDLENQIDNAKDSIGDLQDTTEQLGNRLNNLDIPQTPDIPSDNPFSQLGKSLSNVFQGLGSSIVSIFGGATAGAISGMGTSVIAGTEVAGASMIANAGLMTAIGAGTAILGGLIGGVVASGTGRGTSLGQIGISIGDHRQGSFGF
ncbi:hypothetical protein HDV00_009446, partial [Rhizophlyctis rosea]